MDEGDSDVSSDAPPLALQYMTERIHPVSFWISDGVPCPADPVPSLLQFVADVNTVLAKNTNRRLLLSNDPVLRINDFQLPGSFEFPTEEYPVYVCLAPGPRTGQGWVRVAPDGGSMLMMETPALYYPDQATQPFNEDYWRQIHIANHEFAHGCGCAIGEDYDRYMIDDPTGIDPLVPVSALNPNDSLWGRLPDYAADPMLHQAPQGKFSDHNARVINGNYRISRHMVPCAPMDQCSVLVQDDGIPIAEPWPISGVRVRIWSVDSNKPICTLLTDAMTGADGRVPFTWPDNPNTNDAVLVKCHKDGYKPAAGWLTLTDLEEAGMDGEPLEGVMRMESGVETPQRIVLEAFQGVPGHIRITGLIQGQPIEVLSGPIGGHMMPMARFHATGESMFWQDPTPKDDPSRMYVVRTLPATGMAATPAVRRAALDPMAGLCKMCAGNPS